MIDILVGCLLSLIAASLIYLIVFPYYRLRYLKDISEELYEIRELMGNKNEENFIEMPVIELEEPMDLKPGDKIRLKQSFVDEMDDSNFTWHNCMVDIPLTVKDILDVGVSIEEQPYLLSYNWIEEVPEDVGDQPDTAAC